MNNPDWEADEITRQKREVLDMHEKSLEHHNKMEFWGSKDRTASKTGMKQKALQKRRKKNKLSRKQRRAA